MFVLIVQDEGVAVTGRSVRRRSLRQAGFVGR